MEYKICDFCKNCQKKHIKQKGKWEIRCNGIPKQLWDGDLFPLKKFYGKKLYSKFSKEKKVRLQYKHNKLLWAKDKLGWTTYHPTRQYEQFYQKHLLLCTAFRKVNRLGRRMGKSEYLSVEAIHYADNYPNSNIRVFTPWNNTAEEIFERMVNLLSRDKSVFKKQMKSKAIKTKKQPYTIKFPNGSNIKLFTTGTESGKSAGSTRGQSGDKVFIDEAAYMSKGDINTLYNLLLEHDMVQFVATSTPSALETHFKSWALKDPNFKGFHYPATLLPSYQRSKEDFKRNHTEQSFALEILAEFFEDSSKVFKTEDIKTAKQEYNYYHSIHDLRNPNDWIVSIGVDWNEWKNGVQIVVLGYNLKQKKVKILKRISMHNRKRLQTLALQKIIELDKNFQANYVYVDKGHGSMQDEKLSEYYRNKGVIDKYKAIDFSSNHVFDERNPLTNEKIKKRMKTILIFHLQKRFEYEEIIFSSNEETGRNLLLDQLKDYHVDRYDNKDNPIFAAEADHIIDALAIANFAIIENIDKAYNLKRGSIKDEIVTIKKELISYIDVNKLRDNLSDQEEEDGENFVENFRKKTKMGRQNIEDVKTIAKFQNKFRFNKPKEMFRKEEF